MINSIIFKINPVMFNIFGEDRRFINLIMTFLKNFQVAEARAEVADNIVEEGEVEGRDVAVQDQADNDNWREWERVADELTWQRLLGLDGSLLFLEHVFWVISLNTLFTVLFGMSFLISCFSFISIEIFI